MAISSLSSEQLGALRQTCAGIAIYVQVYGAAQTDEVRRLQQRWGLPALPIEDVVQSARRRGRPDPLPVRQTTIRYHMADARACAEAIGQAQPAWRVEPLSARLTPSPKTVEVWIAPPAGR
ncbi:MAG: hypothetical protein QM639_20250 [Rhodocyclaceae bacterium]